MLLNRSQCFCQNAQVLDKNEAEEYIEFYLEKVACRKLTFKCSQCGARWRLSSPHTGFRYGRLPRLRRMSLPYNVS
jgi:hypothetical protein